MSIAIRLMRQQDLEFGLRLTGHASWNQTHNDWQRFLTLEPAGCFLAEYNGVPAGTTIACCFGKTAWIAMVLVRPELRRRGIARALMEHALRYLEQRHVSTIRLDATPLGRPLYEKLGFRLEYSLTRFGGIPLARKPIAAATIRPALSSDLESVLELDRLVSQSDRSALLRLWWFDNDVTKYLASHRDQFTGYLLARPGRRAFFIGPIIAAPEVGPALLNSVLNVYAGRSVYIDVPDYQEVLQRLLSAFGLDPERPLYRMCLGEPPMEMRHYLCASAGPEYG